MKKIVPEGAHLIPKDAQRVFKGVIFDVYQWNQTMFDGSEATFEMLKRADGGSVIAIKDDKIVMLKQRQPHWKEPRYTLPGGRVESGETPLQSAQRETLEETGMSFKNWKLISVIQNHEKIEYFIHVFLATGFESQAEIQLDPGEKIEVELLDFDTVKKLSANEPRLRSFKDYKSLQDLLAAPEFRGQEIDI